jgi:hypothetical protein
MVRNREAVITVALWGTERRSRWSLSTVLTFYVITGNSSVERSKLRMFYFVLYAQYSGVFAPAHQNRIYEKGWQISLKLNNVKI